MHTGGRDSNISRKQHSSSLSREHNHSKSSRNLKIAFYLNLVFCIFEFFGAIWTNSLAILSDALHDFGDSVALAVAWYLERKSHQKGNKRFTFGYRRFSLLGALINGGILIGGSIFILIQTVPRLIAPEPVKAEGMLLFAIVGIAINGFAAWKLQAGKTLNEKVVSWHLFEDVLGWIAVLVVSIVLLFKDIPILDPILSIAILLYVLFNVFGHMRKAFLIFLQSVPEGFSTAEIEKAVVEISQVTSVHHTHLWSMDGEVHVVTLHVVVEAGVSIPDLIRIKRETKECLAAANVGHATVELEFAGEECYPELAVLANEQDN